MKNLNIKGYKIKQILGKGSFGTVYKAFKENTGQEVAIKVLRFDKNISENQRKKLEQNFINETKLIIELQQHNNIISLSDRGVTEHGDFYAVFRYINGDTLKQYIAKQGALTLTDTLKIMRQVASGLAFAHEHGVIHRDLKPQNIMINTPNGELQAFILDFGISTLMNEDGLINQADSHFGAGTPAYCAPEQIHGRDQNQQVDIWAWGLIFIECITGNPVIPETGRASIVHYINSLKEVFIPTILKNHALANILRKATQISVENRYVTGHQLCQELDLIIPNTLPDQKNYLAPHNSIIHKHRPYITVLSCNIALIPKSTNKNLSLKIHEQFNIVERLDILQKDLFSKCQNIALLFGSAKTATLANNMLVYYGISNFSDRDEHRAARAALRILNLTQHTIKASHLDIDVHIRAGIYTGIAISTQQGIDGLPVVFAQTLAIQAESGTVLVGEDSYQRLKHSFTFEHISSSHGSSIPAYKLIQETKTLNHFNPNLMVDRNKDLDKLHTLWGLVQYQLQGQCLLLLGEPGIGKTTLVNHLSLELKKSGISIFTSRCLPEHSHSSFSPIIDLFINELNLNNDTQNSAFILKQALEPLDINHNEAIPIVANWLNISLENYHQSTSTPEQKKSIFADTMLKWIMHLAVNSPIMLVIEDMHWSDSYTPFLLGQLLEHLQNKPIYLVLTARPEFSNSLKPDFVTQSSGHPLFSQHTLGEFSESQVKALTQQILGQNDALGPMVLSTIITRSGGNPLFVKELLNMMLDSHLEWSHTQHQWVFKPGVNKEDIPSSINDVLIGRLNQLGASKTTAQMASAIGREFSKDLLQAALNIDQSMVQDHLDTLLTKGFIVLDEQQFLGQIPGTHFVFRHALIQTIIHKQITDSKKQIIHAKIAHAIETIYPQWQEHRPHILAYHYGLASDAERSIYYGNKAAIIAQSLTLHDTVQTITEHSYQLLPKVKISNRINCELSIAEPHIQALMDSQGWASDPVKQAVERCYQLVNRSENSQQRNRVLYQLTLYHHLASHRNTARKMCLELIEQTTAKNDTVNQTAAYTVWGHALWMDGDYTHARAILLRAIKCYDSVREQNLSVLFNIDCGVWAKASHAQVTWFITDKHQALDLAQQAITQAQSLNHPPSVCLAYLYLSFMHQYDQNKEQAALASQTVLNLATQYYLPAMIGYASLVNYWATDHLDGYQDGVNQLENSGCKLALTYYSSLYADILSSHSKYQQAIDTITQSIDLCPKLNEHYYEPLLYQRRCAYYLLNNQKTLAIKDLQHAINIAKKQSMYRYASELKGSLVTLLD